MGYKLIILYLNHSISDLDRETFFFDGRETLFCENMGASYI